MLAPLRNPPSCPVDLDLGRHLDMLDAEDAREAAVEALVTSDYLDDDGKKGFTAEFFEEMLVNGCPPDLCAALEKANAGYTGNPYRLANRAACLEAGRVLLDWMHEKAWERAAQRVDAGDR